MNSVLVVDDKDLQLTSFEYKLICFLMKNKNKVFTKGQLYKNVWDQSYLGEVFSVGGMNGKPYIFIFKIDKEKVEHSFIYKTNFSSKSDSLLSLKVFGTLYLILGLTFLYQILILING